jgi:hypothetical protein
MARHSTSCLSGINTPVSPGDALARFSPLKSCGVVPLQLPKHRQASSRWRHDAGEWRPESGNATAVTRSVSASAVPITSLPPKAFQKEHFTRDRVTGWRPTVRQERTAGNENASYTAEQMAGLQLYEMKSKRLSSLEYGAQITIAEVSVQDNHYDPPARQETPTPWVVELEASTPAVSPITASPAMFAPQSQPCAVPSPPNHSPVRFPTNTPSRSITRKPVGSGSRVRTPTIVRSTSDSLLIWPLERSKNLERPRSQSPHKRQLEWEFSSMLDMDQVFSPWDTHISPPSPSPSFIPRGYRPRSSTKRLRPPVRFQSDRASEPSIESTGPLRTGKHYEDHRSPNCGTRLRCVFYYY